MKIFFVQFFCVFLPSLLNIFCFCSVHTISVLYRAHLCMKCSFGISDFLEEISSLSHSEAHAARSQIPEDLWLRIQREAGDQHAKCGREELPHVRGQGQKPGGPHAPGEAAKRSYPTSEVRGSSQECQAATAQECPKEATPWSELRGGGWEEQPHVQGAVAAQA